MPPANFLQCICAKNYETWLAVDKVIAYFFGPHCSPVSFHRLLLLHFLTNKREASVTEEILSERKQEVRH